MNRRSFLASSLMAIPAVALADRRSALITQRAPAAGGGGGGSPPSTNLMVWLKADSLVLSDTDPVGTWTDSSGNGNDLTQTTAGDKPEYRTNQIDGKPALRFISADWMTMPDGGFDDLTSGEIFVVLKMTNDPSASNYFNGIWQFGSAPEEDHYPFSDGDVYMGWGSNTRYACGNPGTSLATWHLLNIRSAANDWKILINQVELFSTASNTVGFTQFPIVGVATSGSYIIGFIAEIIMYNTVLGSGPRSDVISYLDAKYPTIGL